MEKLIEQAPYIAALVIIVYVFLNAQVKRDALFVETQIKRDTLYVEAQTKRDALFIAELNSVTSQLRVMQDKLSEHSEETTAGIHEMRRTVAAFRKNSKKRNAN